MTNEEAIRILDPETSQEAIAGYGPEAAQRIAISQALGMAISALRAQRPHTLEGCEMCGAQWTQADWADGGAHDFRIDGDDLFYFDEQFGWEGIKIKYCPFCGCPLTEEARAEQWAGMRRNGELEETMERLTYRGERDWEVKGADGAPCDEVCENRFLSGCHDCPIQTAFDRLAAYEDAMPIERAQELAQAEKDGRLVVLPCKPEQTVWVELPVMGRVYSVKAPDITWIVKNIERFGREIFLTREEAEAALKKREVGEN